MQYPEAPVCAARRNCLCFAHATAWHDPCIYILYGSQKRSASAGYGDNNNITITEKQKKRTKNYLCSNKAIIRFTISILQASIQNAPAIR